MSFITHQKKTAGRVSQVLALSCGCLLIVSGWIFWGMIRHVDWPTNDSSRAPSGPMAHSNQALQERLKKIEASMSAKSWNNSDRRLFSPALCFYSPNEKRLETVQLDSLIEGIPYRWLRQHRLNFAQPGIAKADPDGDGFSNLQEYAGGEGSTDPQNPASHPSIAACLRVRRVEYETVQLQWRSQMELEGRSVVQMNWSDKEGDHSKIIPLGGEIAEIEVRAFDFRGSIPTLEIRDKRTGQTFSLERRQLVEMNRARVEFVLLLPQFKKWTCFAQVGEKIILPQNEEWRFSEMNEQGARLVMSDPAANGDLPRIFVAPSLSQEETQTFAVADTE